MTIPSKIETVETPPKPEKIPYKFEKHNHTRVDNYFWLKNKDTPQVMTHLKKENDYTEKILAPFSNLKEQIYLEIKSRVIEDEASAPYTRGHFQYSSRYVPGKQYLVYERVNLRTNKKETLIDQNQEATGSDFYESTGPIMSYDQRFMAYAIDKVGRRFYTLMVKDLEQNHFLPVKIENTTGNLVWSKNNNYFFFTKQHPETLRSYQVFRHDIQKNKSTLIYEEQDDTYSVYLYQNLAKKYIFITSSSTLTTEVHYLESHNPLGKFKIFNKRTRGHEYEVYDGGDRFYIKSNTHAPNFRIFEASPENINENAWKEIVPHNNEVLIESLIPFQKFLVILEKEQGLDQIKIVNRIDNSSKRLQLHDTTYTLEPGTQGDFEKNQFRYVFESMRQPEQTFDYNLLDSTTKLVKERVVPGFDPNKYSSERLWVKSRDGKQIPVSVLQLKNHAEKKPVLIYAYGSYGASMTPWFSQSIFSLVDRGFIFAIAHVRGGSELGRKWYEEGRVEYKLNTFLDFIDVTEYFHQQSHVDTKNIFAMGGSAGGLLMGGIVNMRPDLYKAIVAQVPFVDVMTTMLDDSIPLTTSEYDEWGNPNEKKYYDYILQYSPYDNISKQKYPYILATTGLHDSQVQYWEPAKWVAKLRDHNQSRSSILLKVDLESGHGGASGRYEYLKEKAFEYTFVLSNINKDK